MPDYNDAAQPGGDTEQDAAAINPLADAIEKIASALLEVCDRVDELDTKLSTFIGAFDNEASNYQREEWKKGFDTKYGQDESIRQMMDFAKGEDGTDLRDVVHDLVLEASRAAQAARDAAGGEAEPFDEDKVIGGYFGGMKSNIEKMQKHFAPKQIEEPKEASVEVEIKKEEPKKEAFDPEDSPTLRAIKASREKKQ